MLIMSINAGSSSLKYCLFDMDDDKLISKGVFERIGIDDSFYTIKYNGEKIKESRELNNINDAVKVLLDRLITLNIVRDLNEINAVGHRIVQGLDVFKNSCIVNDEVIEKLNSIKDFAPLHNPKSLETILAFKELLPSATNVCVFDTSFHQSMDEVAYSYPIPLKWRDEYSIRKYGAHGTSHRYIAMETEKILDKKEYKLISCHLGSGASICAIKDGKCVDTSMGFTPMAGVMMGTRCGDIDASFIPYIMEKEGKNCFEIINDLNTKSGLLGMSCLSSDMRDINQACDEGDSKSLLAREKYVQRIVDYIAQYYVLLEGCDIIVFTAGVGENNPNIRKMVIDKLNCLGIKIDNQKNDNLREFGKISSKNSKALVYVIPTDEEKMIALDTVNLINQNNL